MYSSQFNVMISNLLSFSNSLSVREGDRHPPQFRALLPVCSVLIIHVPILIIDNNLSMGSKVSTLYLIQ